MNAEFNWWLLIVGLVVGAGLVWFVVADSRRRDADIEADERPREAIWLLELHRVYLESPPPDDPAPQVPPVRTGSGATIAPSAATRDTPNVAPPSSPATAGDGPTQ